MQQHTNTISILQHHVDTAISLIQSLKQQNQQLTVKNQALTQELEKYKTEFSQEITKSNAFNDKITSYEDKLRTLEQLLDEAQNEQVLLEQSILTAINNLGAIDNIHSSDAPAQTTAHTITKAQNQNTSNTSARNIFVEESENDEEPQANAEMDAMNKNSETLEIF